MSQPAAAADTVLHRHKTLPFPIEINRMIYNNIFGKAYWVIWTLNSGRRAESLNILQVSSTVYKEAFHVLYNDSTFKFDIEDSTPVSEEVFNAKVQSGKRVRLDVHCFPNETTQYPGLTKRVNRYIKALICSPQPHHLQLSVNKFAISRTSDWKTFRLFGRFEVIEIHALLQTYGFARLTPMAIAIDKATSETRGQEAMAELVERMGRKFGPVKVCQKKLEGRPPRGIATDSDYWLIAKAEPKMKGFNPHFARGLEKFIIRQAKMQ